MTISSVFHSRGDPSAILTHNQLLTKILEVNPDIKVNAAAVAEAWRKLNDLQKLSLLLTSQLGTAANEGEAKPTPRAIAERLARIRQLIRGKHGDGPGKKGSISLKPSSTNGVAPKARNAPITGTSAPLKNKFQAKPVKTEGKMTLICITGLTTEILLRQ